VADEGRVAHEVGAVVGGEDFVPVAAQGVVVDDGRGFFQGDAGVEFSEGFRNGHVHLVVGQPERGLGDAGGEFLDFDAVKLVDVDAGDVADFKAEGELVAVEGAEDVEFEGAEFAVGHNEEIAAAAGGVEEAEARDAVVKFVEVGLSFAGGGGLGEDFGQLGAEVVEEEGVDDAADVFLGGVVGAFGAAFAGFHDALKERAEDAGGDARPVKAAALEEGDAVRGGGVGEVEAFGEEAAVDVGEGAVVGGEVRGARGGGGVEHLEEAGEAFAEVGAVAGGVFNEAGEGVPGEDV